MGDKPVLSGSLSPKDGSQNVGNIAFWVVDSDNENAPMYNGTIQITLPVLGETLELKAFLWNREQE